jgi:hypothetical protein
VDRYTPDVPAAAQSNLVVDGFINPQGSTVIKLSRSFSVNTKNTAPAEAKAQVAIQDDAGQRYTLAESPAGTYTSAALTLDPSRQYQLRITTAQSREYASDLTPAIITPPVDSLTWQPTSQGGVQLYLTTHAAATAARCYRWEYEETYQFHSAFKSEVEYMASTNTLERRLEADQIFTCWRTEASTEIVQGTTGPLSQNALVAYPLLTVLPSNKLHFGYSLLARQVAQTQAEYEYWERLRKSTENLGTVNDPLPARVTGNVHALADAAEPVLGYVGVHSVTQKRLFINASQLPPPRPTSTLYDAAYANCIGLDTLLRPSFMLAQTKLGHVVPVTTIPDDALFDKSVPLRGYRYSSTECVDCRVRGTNVKPSFWP